MIKKEKKVHYWTTFFKKVGLPQKMSGNPISKIENLVVSLF